jgi:hypothetical protein
MIVTSERVSSRRRNPLFPCKMLLRPALARSGRANGFEVVELVGVEEKRVALIVAVGGKGDNVPLIDCAANPPPA